MSPILNERERKALLHAISFIEAPSSFPCGIDIGTLKKLEEKGFLEYGTDFTYGNTGYKTTEAGAKALFKS